MNLESALDSVIRDYSVGTYSSRIRIDDPDPVASRIAERINRLLDVSAEKITDKDREVLAEKKNADQYAAVLKKISDDLVSLSRGDTAHLSILESPNQTPTQAHQYTTQVAVSIQEIKETLQTLNQDFSYISDKIAAGKMDSRIDHTRYHGVFLVLASTMNNVLESICEPLHESVNLAQKFAAYDFEARFDKAVRISGDWIVLRQALDTIGVQIHDAFGSINNQVMELSANAEQATASVQEVANTSQQVAKNSDAVSQNTEQSDAGVRQVLRAMEDLSVTVGEVSQKAESVSRIAQESTKLSREGTEFAKKAEEGMTVITMSAGDMDRLIGEIQQEMKKINEIVRLITDIANQTNLLALNAAIEAARAGELGRGFAVVASEVKALALESRGSAEKITDMISNLQKQSQKAADAVSVATTAVKDGNVMLSDTLRIFGHLVQAVEDISMNIEQVASMNEEQAAAVEEITSSMHEVSAMLKDTAKEAIDSAHATSETSASVNQLRVIVDQVAGISEQISVSMSGFRF